MPAVRRDRARRGARRLPVLGDRGGHRAERAVPDAARRRRRRRAERTPRQVAATATRASRRAPMFITKKHLSRRTVLRGVGATRRAAAARRDDSGAHGARADGRRRRRRAWASSTSRTARSWTSGRRRPRAELRAVADPRAARAVQEPAHDRQRPREQARRRARRTRSRPARGCRGVSPRISHDPYGGVTADQIAAQHIGQDTPLPSLEVATEEAVGGGACDRNYGCSYGATISFRTPSTPLPMEFNPRKLFQRLFGQGDTPEERELLAAQYASILDVVAGKAAALQKRRRRRRTARMLDDYLESVREIERRVQKMEANDLSHIDAAGCARRHSDELRRADEPDVRHGRARVAGEPHARSRRS